MRKSFLLVVMAMTALCAAATDMFYIEGFSISAGETRTVSILLDNETAYTAFQTDIYLPEGLIVEQEDGDYIFDLTSRKGRDHNIASQVQADGAIRIMSYSPSIKTYSGNSGALVTFNVTAREDFAGLKSIELKNTIFSTTSGMEIPFNDETCQVTGSLNDLTGEIVFEEGGDKTSAMDENGNIIDMYQYLYISYSGNEDVVFTIFVNECDLLNDEILSRCVSWDEENKRYVVSLYYLIGYFGDQYCAGLDFFVTIHADGYNDLSMDHYSFVSFLPYDEPGFPSISEDGMSDLTFFVRVCYGYSVHYCNLDGIYDDVDDNWELSVYAIERLDHDYYLTVRAASRTPMSSVYIYRDTTFLIPARECDISISQYQGNGLGRDCIVFNDGNPFLVKDKELDGSFTVIECNASSTSLHITINGSLLEDSYPTGYSYASAVNLLPFGDIFGGQYEIEATASDGYFSVSTDTLIEIHPVVTRLTRDSLVLDVAADMNIITLLVDGEEVELSTNGHFYSLERLDHDYSVSVQARVFIATEWGDYSEFSNETIIMIPAKEVASTLCGDVNGDNAVNISDVTALIDYLLSGDDSAIILSNADCDGNGAVNISDVTALIDYLLIGYLPEP